jgi:hypothetical protein
LIEVGSEKKGYVGMEKISISTQPFYSIYYEKKYLLFIAHPDFFEWLSNARPELLGL